MAKSPFSSAGGGHADSKPHEFAARKHGGRVDGHHRKDGGNAEKATLKEAGGKKSIGFVEGEDAKPRLDRKHGGAAHHPKHLGAKGGKEHAKGGRC